MKTLSLALMTFLILGASQAAEESFELIKRKSCQELKDQIQSLFHQTSKRSPLFYPTPKDKGLALIVHGLNHNPSLMGDKLQEGSLVKSFLDQGYSVVRVTLPGHDEDINEMKNVKADLWQKAAYLQFCKAEIERNQKPLILVAFSLGALVFEELINEKTQTALHFDKAILFAPAIGLRGFTYTLKWLSFLKNDQSLINSIAPQEYRAHPGSSLGAYKALFELEEKLFQAEFDKNNLKTLVFIHPEDEVVDEVKLKKSMKKFGLGSWSISEVHTKDSQINPKYHHLIIDRRTLGDKEWARVNNEMMKFLQTP